MSKSENKARINWVREHDGYSQRWLEVDNPPVWGDYPYPCFSSYTDLSDVELPLPSIEELEKELNGG